MTTLFIILIILVSVILAFFVLIQNPKGGGLSSGFAGGSNLMGVQRTGDFLEKGTWTMAILLILLSIAVNIVGPNKTATTGGNLSNDIEAPVQSAPLNLNTNPAAGQAPATTPDSAK